MSAGFSPRSRACRRHRPGHGRPRRAWAGQRRARARRPLGTIASPFRRRLAWTWGTRSRVCTSLSPASRQRRRQPMRSRKARAGAVGPRLTHARRSIDHRLCSEADVRVKCENGRDGWWTGDILRGVTFNACGPHFRRLVLELVTTAKTFVMPPARMRLSGAA